MKLAIKSVNPKNLFCSKKSRTLSNSEPSSFDNIAAYTCSPSPFSSSSSSSTSSDDHDGGKGKGHRSTTPTSVLQPARSLSAEWSESSGGSTYLELVEAFKLIDQDGDGKITRREMESLLSRIAGGFGTAGEEEIATMLSEIDRDGDGCISIEEFGALSAAFGPATGADELRETFDVFDADHDGKITAEELKSVFSAIGDERCTLQECRRMIESVDANGDGFVCFEDFCRMMDHQFLQRSFNSSTATV